MADFHGSYLKTDVTFLLTVLDKKDVPNIDPAQKETLIQSGKRHYSEMLTLETPVSDTHLAIYKNTLDTYQTRMANDIHLLANTLFDIFKSHDKPVILVSLVRAGVPVGVLLQRAFSDCNAPYHRPSHHYGMSIIRDRGIDDTALAHIIKNHPDCPIVFVDGWTGKGAIFGELSASLTAFCQKNPTAYHQIYHQNHTLPLVVLADPAGVAWLSASDDDWLMPSSLLNSTISGLVSRTLYRTEGFHGCVYYDELDKFDESLNFITHIDHIRQTLTNTALLTPKPTPTFATQALIAQIATQFAVTNINRIKPTIAEATRAIMRRQPSCVILHDDDADTALLHHLCHQKNIPIIYQDIYPYKAITLIEKRH